MDVFLRKFKEARCSYLLLLSALILFSILLSHAVFKSVNAAVPLQITTGIGLAFFLLGGYRYLLSIVVGMLAGTALIIHEYTAGGLGLFQQTLLICSIVFGATLQLVVSGYIIKKRGALSILLGKSKDLYNVFIPGMLGSAIGTTISITALWFCGLITGKLSTLWLTWFIGDAVGIMIFTPLILLLFSSKSLPARKASVGIPTIVLFGFIVAILLYAHKTNEQALRAVFNQFVSQNAKIISRDAHTLQETLDSVKQFYGASSFVSRQEFRSFTKIYLERYPYLESLAWVPRIHYHNLKYYQKQASDDGYDGFFAANPVGNTLRNDKQTVYLPIFYAEPAKQEKRMLGIDLASDITFSEKLNRSAKPNQQIILTNTSPLDSQLKKGFYVFSPIYKQQEGVDKKIHQADLTGFIMAFFDVPNLIENALVGLDKQGIKLHILDKNSKGVSKLIYGEPDKNAVFYERIALDMGGHNWSLVFSPTQEFLQGQYTQTRGWLFQLLKIMGFLFVALLQIFLLLVTARAEETKNLEAQRVERIAEIEAKSYTVLDNVIDGIITINSKGIIDSANRACEKIFGYHIEDLIGQNVKMLMPEPYVSEHDGYLANYIETGTKKIIGSGREVKGKRRDGSVFDMDLSVSEIRIGSRRLFTGIVRDITEKKQIGIIKNEFISTVSHELRTPLTAIHGALGLLKVKAYELLDDKSRRLLDLTYKNSERLSRLVNDILDIQKISVGKMDYHLEIIDIGELTQEVIDSNEGYAEKHEVSYVMEPYVDKVYCLVDAHRYSQVLSNLLSNAAKFSPRGKSVIINIDSSVARSVRVSVKDYGPGIPESFKDKMFSPFAQADASSTKEKGGTGLGLNIAKSIIEEFGGTISFESEENKSTTFYFILPTCQPDENKKGVNNT